MSQEIIHLNLKSEDGEEITFKVKNTTKFSKIFQKYCEKKNIANYNSVRFLFEGERINDNLCPNEMGIENNDEIDVRFEQVGGF